MPKKEPVVIGRIVHFLCRTHSGFEESPAIITKVWQADLVNLFVFRDYNQDDQVPERPTSVQYRVPNTGPDQIDQSWHWPRD